MPEAEKVCSHCGEPKARIGEDEARVLQFIPAHFELHVHVLPKYACSHCRDGVVAPEPPPRPVSGCIAGPACFPRWSSPNSPTICRYIDSKISRRVMVSICHGARSAIGSAKSADLLGPLYELQKELVRSAAGDLDRRHARDGAGRRQARQPQGAVLGSTSAPPPFPYDVYDFTENRKRDGPARSWRSYAGYLQADAFSGYDGIYTGSDGRILEVACWSHARRKFFEARSSSPGKRR